MRGELYTSDPINTRQTITTKAASTQNTISEVEVILVVFNNRHELTHCTKSELEAFTVCFGQKVSIVKLQVSSREKK